MSKFESSKILESLTYAQRAAVGHIDGPLLVVAGPGSGKTRVITHRIANLIHHGVRPASILALTFTNKAADEMKRRIRSLVSEDVPWVSTFHRFCAQMLRRYAAHVGLESNFTIYDTDDSLKALKQTAGDLDLDLSFTPLERIARAISHMKNQLVTPEQFLPRTGNELGPILQRVYPEYQRHLLKANAADFDDLLCHFATALRQSNELRSTLDDRFRYVMVDEYQDTNLAQYAIVRALSIDHPNLAVTGDPDQAIYGWRGANLTNILEFEKDYPSVRVVRLEENYRSTPRILRVADALIANNTRRLKKSLFTNNPDGPPVRLVCYPSQKEEAFEIVDQIEAQIRSGRRRLRDFAIFYRTNALSRNLESALRDRGLPYQIVNGLQFYQRKEIKDVFAYLHLLNNPRDNVAVLRIINVPARKIGKTTIDRLVDHARNHDLSLLDAARQSGMVPGIAKAAAVNVAKFVSLLDRLGEHALAPVEEIIGHVQTETGYRQLLVESNDSEDQERLANLEELLTDAREFDEQNPGGGHLEAFLERSALVSDIDAWEQDSDRVTLMTLHAAKGLEFPVVFITAVEQGIIPHERSKKELENDEEERRLLFVGITRAQHELQLSTVQYRSFRGAMTRAIPSQFLMELPRAEMQLVEPARQTVACEYAQCESFPADVDCHLPDKNVSIRGVLPTPLSTGAELLARTSVNGDPAGESSSGVGVDPSVFRVGMAVVHPEHGLGKVVALSGVGKKRTATVNFAVGAVQRKFVVIHSPLRPAGL
jgi:DNA helicase-2/ATP-dependent DNA helicase PcrA